MRVRLVRPFEARLLLVMLAGLAVRLLYTALSAKGIPVMGDAMTFHLVGAEVAHGHGFVRVAHPELPATLPAGEPTAEHPPAFEVLIAGLVKLGADGFLAQKLALCGVGTLTVGLTGLAAREAAGERAGLIAAALAAVYPLLWIADGSLMSETLYGVFVSLSMLLGVRMWKAPSVRLALALGASIALAALTRGEAIGLLALLLLPLCVRGGRTLGGRARLLGAGLAAFLVVVAPWSIRNAVTFGAPVLISTNGNAVFVGSNCDAVYHGPFIGLWNFDCYGATPPGDEAEQSVEYRRRGLEYARDHAGRLPLVMAARLGRVWDFFKPRQQAAYEFFEGRSPTASRVGLGFYYPLLVLAAAGAAILRRRRGPLWPLLAFPTLVSLVGILVYGVTRFRFAAEPALVVLGAVALDAALARLRPGRARAEREPSPVSA